MQTAADPAESTSWRAALPFALLSTALVLGLFYYWFAVADRYVVFLYDHDMGPLYPDTSAFSRVTSSRYWMAGLVASGASMTLYVAVNWLLGRLRAWYHAPAWWQVWALCAVPVAVGIPAITMTVNDPTLPASNAAQITLAALAGLSLAFVPGGLAARRPAELALLAVDGFALMLVLMDLTNLEQVPRWMERGANWRVGVMFAVLPVAVSLLLLSTSLRIWRRRSMPGILVLLFAGLCVAYLFMPLVHHIGYTDGYYYVSDSDNYFARSGLPQVATWLGGAGVALSVTWSRERLAARWARIGRR